MKNTTIHLTDCTDPSCSCGPGALAAPCCSSATTLDDETLATMAKALGHPARVALLRFLASQEVCFVGSLADHLPLAQSTISEHLRILKESGLVQGNDQGRGYCLRRPGLQALAEAFCALSGCPCPPEAPHA